MFILVFFQTESVNRQQYLPVEKYAMFIKQKVRNEAFGALVTFEPKIQQVLSSRKGTTIF